MPLSTPCTALKNSELTWLYFAPVVFEGRATAFTATQPHAPRPHHVAPAAVHARAAGHHQVRDAMAAAVLQHAGDAGEIAGHVGVRMIERVAHAGLRGEVHDLLRAVRVEHRRERGGVGDVHLLEAKAGMRGERSQPGLLERRRVVVVQVVDADHAVAVAQQAVADQHADESGCAGDEDRGGHPGKGARGND